MLGSAATVEPNICFVPLRHK